MTASVSNLAASPPGEPVRAALDDPDVCERLRRQAHALLHRYAGVRSVDIDDVLQKTKLRAIECRAAFDGGRAVGPWLHGVLVNVVREEVRGARRRPVQQPADPALWETAATAQVAPEVDIANERLRAERFLNLLSAGDREVVRLRFFEGASLRDIAARLGIEYVAARMRFSRAMRRLQELAGASQTEERP